MVISIVIGLQHFKRYNSKDNSVLLLSHASKDRRKGKGSRVSDIIPRSPVRRAEGGGINSAWDRMSGEAGYQGSSRRNVL